MNKDQKAAYIFWLVVTLVPIAGVFVSVFSPELFFAEQEKVRDWIESFGDFSIFVFIFIQIIQVVITPISHYTTSIIGGFLYGKWWGALWNWVGRVIGQYIAYYLADKYGRNLVLRFISDSTMERFDEIVNGSEETFWTRVIILFAMIFLPFFPDDEISYLCGLAGFNKWYFFVVTALGHVGGSAALAYAGAGINTRDIYFWVIVGVTFFLFGILLIAMFSIRRKEKTDT